MKYLVVLSDGMADWPLAELGNRTPMEAAHKPNMNKIASLGRSGLVKSLFPGMPTGSDVANMCILGYDPRKFYTGRSPIEAIGLQLELTPEDMVYRANLVSISAGDEPFEQKLMLAHDGANIEEDEAQILVSDLQNEIGRDVLSIHYGARYREILIWKNAEMDHDLVPPHDFTGGCIGEHLPQGKMADEIIALEKRSYDFLMKHPLNIERMAHGLRPANCIWLWGHGKKPAFYNFEEKRHVRGSIITAVPLLTGIAYGIGFDAPKVPGVTGDINTNYDGKANAAIEEFKNGKEFVFVHVEAPDECGHNGDTDGKVRSIELIDEKILGPIWKYLESTGEDYRILVTPDHPTPVAVRTHVAEPIPFALYQKGENGTEQSARVLSEAAAAKTGLFVEEGYKLIDELLK